MFKKRNKKIESKKVSSLVDNTDLHENNSDSQKNEAENLDLYENSAEISKLDRLKFEMRQYKAESRKIGGNANYEDATEGMDSFQQQADSNRDLNEYIEKRINEIEGSELEKLRNKPDSDELEENFGDSKLDMLMNLAQNRNEAEFLSKRDDEEFENDSEGDADEELQKLNDLERLGRKIREENKDSAFWSTGLIEVDIGVEKKAENFENNEADKRDKILKDITKATIPEYFEVKDEEDLSEWLYKPKDKSKHMKELKHKNRKQFNQAFKKEGRHYARSERMKDFYTQLLEDGSNQNLQPKDNESTIDSTALLEDITEKNVRTTIESEKNTENRPSKLSNVNLKLLENMNKYAYEMSD